LADHLQGAFMKSHGVFRCLALPGLLLLLAQVRGPTAAAQSGAPDVKSPAAEPAGQLQKIDQRLAELRQLVATALARIEYSEPKSPDADTSEPKEFIWIEDAPPAGAVLQGDSPWEWVTQPQPVFSGRKSMKRSARGNSQHFFTDAKPGLRIGEGDKLFADVYLDPNNLPKTILMQFNDGVWEHRAFWGEDTFPWGIANSPSRRPIGKLPEAGAWVRLEVSAARVGLNAGAVLNGWAFTQNDGTVYWDKAGIVTRTPQSGQAFASMRAWEAFEREQSDSLVPMQARTALLLEPGKRSAAQQKLVRDYFLENIFTGSRSTFEPLHQEIADLTQQRAELAAAEFRGVVADFDAERNELLKAHREKSAERFLDFAAKHNDDRAALDALMWVISNVEGTRALDRAVELVVQHHLDSGALKETCQRLANGPVANGETLLRTVLAKSPDREVKAWACFALAKDLARRAGSDEKRQAEVDRLVDRTGEEFADVRSLAGAVGEFRRSIGQIAPDIEGEDIDGETFKLSDYRGKVVVLDFWGNW
jgi:hypothetical protein